MLRVKVMTIVFILLISLQPFSAKAIYNGTNSVGTQLTLSLVLKNQRDSFCSMALLNAQIAVTAAHCVIQDQGSAPTLRFALKDMFVSQPGADIKVDRISSRVRVARVVTTSNYINTYKPEIDDRRTQIDDIAFLFLEKPLLNNYSIGIAAEDDINSAISQRKMIEHYGYGFQNIDQQDGKPWKATLPLIDLTSSHLDKSKVIYTREGAAALCPGDSGGPWYLEVDGVKKIAAVTVAASGCRNPGPYTGSTLGTRIYPYLSIMQSAWDEFNAVRGESIKSGKYLEAEGCFREETNAELLYRNLWGYWIPMESPVGWINSDKSCPSKSPNKPWVTISVENQTKVRWHFWEGEKHTYGDIVTWPNNKVSEDKSNDKNLTTTCINGKKVKIISNTKLGCPKGYKIRK